MKYSCFPILGFLGLALSFFGAGPAFANDPAERFMAPLERLEQILAEARKAQDFAEKLDDLDTRQQLFRLEGLFRLYESAKGKPFARAKEKVKGVEDALGAFALARDVAAKAGSEDARELKQARDRFKDYLEKEGWLGKEPKALREIARLLQKTRWESAMKDRDYLLSELAGEARKVARTRYDLKLLEEGVHEFRRDLRWILIEAQALSGLIELGAPNSCPSSAILGVLRDPVARESKYSVFQRAGEKDSCVVSPCLILALAGAVEKLGDIKDEGELAHVGALEAETVDHESLARPIYRFIRDNQVLELLAGELKGCRS